MKKFIEWDGEHDLVLKHPSVFSNPKVWYRGHKHEKRKEKAFDDLVSRTKGFRLIHVQTSHDSSGGGGGGGGAAAATPDKTGSANQVSMKLVSPWRDKKAASQVKKQGYYTVSHVWGPPETLRRVKTPIIDPEADCESGRHVIIRIRPDKVMTMLGLLVSQGPDTYWWVDILCAQVSTPLVHMGSIYKHCKACFAMIPVKDDNAMRDFRPLEAIFDRYDAALEGRGGRSGPPDGGSSSSSSSITAASACLVVPLDEYVPRVLSRIAEMGPVTQKTDWYHLLDVVFPRQQRLLPADLRKIRLLDQHALNVILMSSWWDRVWTLQEAALPPNLYLMNEVQRDLKALRNKDTFVNLDTVLSILMSVQAIVNSIRRLKDKKRPPKEILEYTAWDKFDAYHTALDQRISSITESQSLLPDLMFDVIGHDKVERASREIILASFAVSRRKCSDPTDYIYGTLGLLNLNIPRMNDPKAVWEAFKKELLLQARIAGDIKDIDLTKATCMADVYGQFAIG